MHFISCIQRFTEDNWLVFIPKLQRKEENEAAVHQNLKEGRKKKKSSSGVI